MFQVSLALQSMITVVFWTLIYQHMLEEWMNYRMYTTHGAALILLIGDYLLNDILVEKRHAVFTSIIMLFYTVNIIAVKFLFGMELYSFASLDSVGSWIATFSVGLTFMLTHYLIAVI